MERRTATCKSRDILTNPWTAFVAFGIPVIAIVAIGGPNFSNGWRTLVWTAALALLGTACIVNACRYGRVHCYLTGPFLLLMALVALLYGLHIVPLGHRGWNVIGAIVLVGGVGLCCLPEILLGKYRKGFSADKNGC